MKARIKAYKQQYKMISLENKYLPIPDLMKIQFGNCFDKKLTNNPMSSSFISIMDDANISLLRLTVSHL